MFISSDSCHKKMLLESLNIPLIQTSIFRYSKNYGSLTHETRIKDAVNMIDLICLLATVRTLKVDKK